MKRRALCLAWVLFLGAALAVAGERPATWYMPADAFLAVCYDGGHPGFRETPVYKFFQEPEVREAVKQWRPLADYIVQEARTGAEMEVAPLFRAAVGTQIAFAITGPFVKPGEPAIVVAARVGTGDAPARRAIEEILAKDRAEAGPDNVREIQVGPLKASAVTDKDGDVSYEAFDGDFFVASNSEALFRQAVDRAGEKLSARLGDERAVLRVHYDHQAMLKLFANEVDEEGRRVLDALGINTIRTAGLAIVPRDGRLVTQVTVDMPAAAQQGGLAKWFADAPPFDPELLKLVPADTAFFWLTMADLPGLWDAIWETVARVDPRAAEEGRQALAQAEGRMGLKVRDAFLRPLGRGTVLLSTTSGLFTGGSVMLQRVRDPKALETALAQLVNRLDLVLMGLGGNVGPVRTQLKTFTYRGHTCRYLWVMGAAALAMQGGATSYTFLGDVMVVAGHPLHLKSYLDFVVDKRPSIAEKAEFQKLRALVPQGATSISYGEWSEVIVSAYNTLAPLVTFVQGLQQELEMPVALDVANMPSSRLLRRYTGGTVLYSVVENGRYRVELQGEGISFLSPHLAPTAAVAILAGMLLPALTRARTEARLIRDRNNLNQIAKGCATYLNEFGDNRRYPASLAELFDKGVIPDPGVFISPLDRAPPKLPNGLPCSYVSCFDKYPKRQFLDDFPPNVMMAWDREPFVPGKRSVLFFDSHVEVVDEAGFKGLVQQLDEHVRQHTKERKPVTEF